jgi:AraC-like DNA-binding protein
MFAQREHEAPGTIGGSIQALQGDTLVFRQDLVNGRHYGDALESQSHWVSGDGTSLESVGQVAIGGRMYRVDALTIDVPKGASFDSIRFRDLGSPASFVIFDIFFEAPAPHGCPFHRSRGVPLEEVSTALRLGDRVKFTRALNQLLSALRIATELDEARGQLLTFYAIVCAASLEFGGGREQHWSLLQLCRAAENRQSIAELVELAESTISELSESMLRESSGPSGYLIDRALDYIERNYAREISDELVAHELSLSTSHFRFLFKQATGQPFQKYLNGLRLEKARQLLVEQKVSVSSAASTVGFSSLAHFSRAFHQRFQVSPSAARRG